MGLKGLISFEISIECSIKYRLMAFPNIIKIKSASFRCHGRCQKIPKRDPLDRVFFALNGRFYCFFVCVTPSFADTIRREVFEWWTRMQNYERVFCFSSLYQFQVLGKKWYKTLYESFQRLRGQHYDWFAVTSCWSSRKQCWHILRKILHIYNHI